MTVLWQAMQVPSPEAKARAIQIVERHQREELSDSVSDLLVHDADLGAAAAAVALLTSDFSAPRIAPELLRSGNAKARAMVVKGIAKKVGRASRADIVPALNDPDVTVRRSAVDAIGRWKHKDDAKLLHESARLDKDPQVRSRSLRALISMGPSEGVVQLATRALDDSYLGSRVAAVALLGKYGGDSAQAQLQTLAESSDFPVALRAATALFKRSGLDQLAVVQRAYASADWMTRSTALNTVASATTRDSALAFAGRGMADTRLEVRLTAARLLLKLGVVEPALKAFREALGADQLSPRLIAATDLARRDDPDAINLLSRMAQTGPRKQREAAFAAHRAAGIVTTGLVAGLGDTNIEVRLTAADMVVSLR